LALGTPAYMSPEQAAGDQHVDGRTDVYSLGCVLFEMLAGEPPYTGPTAQAIIAKRFSEPVPQLRVVRESVPAGVEQSIRRALAKVPADRFSTMAEFGSALREHPRAVKRSILRRPDLRAILVAIGLLAVGVVLRPWSPSRLPLDPNLLAVAPFDVLDPSLHLWREGLVDILSRNLDGAGPLRTVPQTVGLQRWTGRADRASAEKFGRRTNAGLVVFGNMLRKGGDSVSLRATVLDLTGRKSEPDLEVRGDTAMMGELADSLGVRILQALGRNRPIGSVRQVSIGSRSLPALKAFLYGEQFYREGLWDSALVYYDQAIARDSMFALAFARMSIVLRWDPPTYRAYRPEEEYSRRAVRLNHGLSPKDSMLLAADSLDLAAGDAANPADWIRFRWRKKSTLEETAVRFPADPEVWYAVGEERYHSPSPLVGEGPRSALDAFDHAIALDSGFAPAYEHTMQLAMKLNRPDLAQRYAAGYLRSDPGEANAPYIRLAVLLLDPARSHAPETIRLIDTIPGIPLFRAGLEHLGYWADSAESAVRLLQALAGQRHDFPDPDDFVADTLMQRQFLANVLAYRGHLHEAYAADQPLLLDPAASATSAWLDPFLNLSLLGVIPDSLAAAHFGRALGSREAWPMFDFATARQLSGLPWWLSRRDTVSLARFASRAAREASRQETPRGKLQVEYFLAATPAYLALARGDSTGALRLFQAISDTLCLASTCFHEQLILARLLAAQGRNREAGNVLERWAWSGDGAFFGIGMLERGRVAERLDDRQKAIESYQFVVDLWRHADPELQPYVAEARNALARLTQEG
jgi:eukaryotic-like serine/threonine-protein kinase